MYRSKFAWARDAISYARVLVYVVSAEKEGSKRNRGFINVQNSVAITSSSRVEGDEVNCKRLKHFVNSDGIAD